MATNATYNLKTICLERNPTTIGIMSLCRELKISKDDLEDAILSNFDPDWEENGATYTHLTLKFANKTFPTQEADFTLKCEWITQRPRLEFNKWYTEEEAIKLIECYNLMYVDVLCLLNSCLEAYKKEDVSAPVTKCSTAYRVQYYDKDEGWSVSKPHRVMFFKGFKTGVIEE